jgi:hypothetical protein
MTTDGRAVDARHIRVEDERVARDSVALLSLLE